MKRQPTFLEAIIPILALMIFLGIGYGLLRLKIEPALLMAAGVAAIIAKRVGVNWEEMLQGITEKITISTPAILVVLSTGLLIGTWMFCGTIPMMIYYGIQIIDPRFVLVSAFLSTFIVSIFTGTSFGSAGTVGIAIIGIATGLDVSLPATAGAIVAGAYFGDKMSPLSDTTILAPTAAGSELYEHIRHMMYTTLPGFFISLIVYAVVGFNSSVAAVATPQKVIVILNTLDIMFNWNIILLLPPLVILYGAYTKRPPVPVILASSLVAMLLGMFIQNFTVSDLFNSMVGGFNVSMVKVAGFNTNTVIPEISRLINRGGMGSMLGIILIIFCAFSFAGVVTKAGCLEVILAKVRSQISSTGGLIAATVASVLTMALVTGSAYLAILIPGELFKSAYKERGLHAKNLSRTLEDAGTVVVPLIPWSIAGGYMAGTLGVSTLEYLPWAILCYTGPIIAVIYGYTGFSIEKINKEIKQQSQAKTVS